MGTCPLATCWRTIHLSLAGGGCPCKTSAGRRWIAISGKDSAACCSVAALVWKPLLCSGASATAMAEAGSFLYGKPPSGCGSCIAAAAVNQNQRNDRLAQNVITTQIGGRTIISNGCCHKVREQTRLVTVQQYRSPPSLILQPPTRGRRCLDSNNSATASVMHPPGGTTASSLSDTVGPDPMAA
ncbi:hypothetical protein PVAP13_2NG637542 [Panicum virgatum]|uniref:Uncharacterized protein n=1 Tax=Panicum virgatum TaxID=38727 RepID=A0A8T0VSB2_PANVG|nr:hypothetical protein PVAP13_2NG637542 [Panicum virgatum]